MIERNQRVVFLNRIHLFSGLKDDELAGIAINLEEKAFPAESVVFQSGAKPDGFYLIYKGRVKVTRPRENGTDFLAWLSVGDYFGEEALFENRNRSATNRYHSHQPAPACATCTNLRRKKFLPKNCVWSSPFRRSPCPPCLRGEIRSNGI